MYCSESNQLNEVSAFKHIILGILLVVIHGS